MQAGARVLVLVPGIREPAARSGMCWGALRGARSKVFRRCYVAGRLRALGVQADMGSECEAAEGPR